MITIKEIFTRKELKDFVKFPFKLYKDSKYWVPPLIKEELSTFDKNSNPALETADAFFFLAYKDNQIVGRIAVIVNWHEINTQHIKKIRFGWFDFIDDKAVSKALLDKVFEIGKKHQLEYAEGPMGCSNMDKVGLMIEGFDHIGSMITWYNYPYYKDHLEDLKFETEKEFIENEFPFENIQNSDTFNKASELIGQRYGLRAVNFTRKKDIYPHISKMFDLFNRSYASLPSFVAVTEKQKDYFKKKYINFINPKFIKFIFDKNDEMVAFAVIITSFSKALQKAKGKLFPFGFIHLLRAKKKNDTVLFYLIGIAPEYQNKGLNAIIFKECYRSFKEEGVTHCIRTPSLTSNTAVQNIWKHFNPKIFARRRTYKKMITYP